MGLRGVFDDEDPRVVGDGEQAGHVGHLSVQVNDHDGPRAPGDRRAERFWRHEQRVVADVGKPRRRARTDHGGGSGDERVRWDDDLIAGPDPECSQAELQRIGPVGNTHGVIGATVGGPLPLEGLDRRAADVTGAEQAG